MLDGVLVELALFIGVALARAGVGRLRVPTFTLGALLLPLVDAFLCRGATVRRRLDEGELFTVGEGPVVFDAVVHAVVVLEEDVVEFRWIRAFFVDCSRLPTNQRCHAAIGAPGSAYVVRSPASDIGTSW